MLNAENEEGQSLTWRKVGRFYLPTANKPWFQSHSSHATILPLSDTQLRLYFTCRDKNNHSHISWLEIDTTSEPWLVCREAEEPVLSPGKLGAFDDAGAMTSSVVRHGKLVYLYYMGWNLGVNIPFKTNSGLAISQDGGLSFHRFSEGPMMDRDLIDPYQATYPFVLRESREHWRIWYVSCLGWRPGSPPQPRFTIRYATSSDGIHWMRQGRDLLEFADDLEWCLVRPWVVHWRNHWHMWFCYKASPQSNEFRIGYAHSSDGEVWRRDDHIGGIAPSAKGWDSQMVCYPCVFAHQNSLYLIYNGNQYGRTGLGYAVLEDSSE